MITFNNNKPVGRCQNWCQIRPEHKFYVRGLHHSLGSAARRRTTPCRPTSKSSPRPSRPSRRRPRSPTRRPASPCRREHRSQPPGARLRRSDKQNQGLRGAAPVRLRPVLERDEATGEYYVSEDRAYDSTATRRRPSSPPGSISSASPSTSRAARAWAPPRLRAQPSTSSPSRTRSRRRTPTSTTPSTNPSSTTRSSTRTTRRSRRSGSIRLGARTGEGPVRS